MDQSCPAPLASYLSWPSPLCPRHTCTIHKPLHQCQIDNAARKAPIPIHQLPTSFLPAQPSSPYPAPPSTVLGQQLQFIDLASIGSAPTKPQAGFHHRYCEVTMHLSDISLSHRWKPFTRMYLCLLHLFSRKNLASIVNVVNKCLMNK